MWLRQRTKKRKQLKQQKKHRRNWTRNWRAAISEPTDDNPSMITLQGIRCYQAIVCTGGTGIFQRHNFEGVWSLAEGAEISGGHPHYEHRTPNGQVVHLFHVNSAYGGAPRWVIGPVPGNENGWGFVDTPASHPEIIAEKWMVWMETSWEESKRLVFRGLERGAQGDWSHIVEEDDEEDEDEDEDEASHKYSTAAKPKRKKKAAGIQKKAGGGKTKGSGKKRAAGQGGAEKAKSGGGAGGGGSGGGGGKRKPPSAR